MFSLFATLKRMRGETEVHQTNAITSWTQFCSEIILYGEDSRGIADDLGLICHETVDTQAGIPGLDSLFRLAQQHSSHDIVGYMNADVVIVDGLRGAVRTVSKALPSFLMVCRRWDIDLDETLDFETDWRSLVRERIAETDVLHSDCSSDLFLFRRPLWEVLPFTPGRPEWDNWMLWKACDAGVPVVDVTPVVTMAHPNHGYGDDGTMDVRTFWRTSPLVERNRALNKGGQQYCFRHVQRVSNLWRLDSQRLTKV